ncbi:MAG: ABC transporter ATP-binding protein [Cytophagaceae bacterium]|nr:ABC transporter ATP-binding protein [Cytophagaceae bacterium]MDW8456924.1 ABC transporter ATP-binding protein [Cytophagaceae bacterium]
MTYVKLQNIEIDLGGNKIHYPFHIHFNEPCFCAIVGNNGVGKTTLLKAMAGMVPYTGVLILSSIPAYLQQQQFVHFDFTVLELLLMGRYSKKKFPQYYDANDLRHVKTNAQLTQIEHLFHKKINSLSGGEQQLVWITQVLIQEAEIILLDEPTHSLDLYNRKKVFEIMQHLVSAGKIVFCATHDIINLHEMKGYILNLSSVHEGVRTLNAEEVLKCKKILESGS